MKELKEYLIEADMKTTGRTREQAEGNYKRAAEEDPEMIKGVLEMLESYAADKVEEYKKSVTEG